MTNSSTSLEKSCRTSSVSKDSKEYSSQNNGKQPSMKSNDQITLSSVSTKGSFLSRKLRKLSLISVKSHLPANSPSSERMIRRSTGNILRAASAENIDNLKSVSQIQQGVHESSTEAITNKETPVERPLEVEMEVPEDGREISTYDGSQKAEYIEPGHSSSSDYSSYEGDGDVACKYNLLDLENTIDSLILELLTINEKKFRSIRMGWELFVLLKKFQDELCAHKCSFVKHGDEIGISIALHNLCEALLQVFPIAARLKLVKFRLNAKFKQEVLFSFQQINSYSNSLFMELTMAMARERSIETPEVNLPVIDPQVFEVGIDPIVTDDEKGKDLCIKAHQEYFGHPKPKNLLLALSLYKEAADLGNVEAMTCLGRMYFDGVGVRSDLVVAEAWLEHAANGGSLTACFLLGKIMIEKSKHPSNTRKVLELIETAKVRLKQAADRHYCEAQFELGKGFWLSDLCSLTYNCSLKAKLYDSESLYDSQEKALHWYAQAANQMHTGAEVALGIKYFYGQSGLEVDVNQALHYFLRAGEKLDSSAHMFLGVLYSSNDTMEDLEKAIYHYQLAIEQNHHESMWRLAILMRSRLLSGQFSLNCVPNTLASKLKLKEVAVATHTIKYDKHELLVEILSLFVRAADAGLVDAWFQLGDMFETSPMLKNSTVAYQFYTRALKSDPPHKLAAKRAAAMCYSGIGTQLDRSKAHQLYTIAAFGSQNPNFVDRENPSQSSFDAEALNALGLMYEEGEGCDVNFHEAAECFRMAAEMKNSHGHFNLGCLFAQGKGVERSQESADFHFQQATALGYNLAKQFIKVRLNNP